MEDREAVMRALESSSLFRGISPSALKGAFTKTFRRGDTVSETQNGVECVGVVVTGSLSVGATDSGSVSVMNRGGEFGICNIFVREKMPTVLRARVRSSVLFIRKEEFARLLAEDSGLMYRYVRLCNEKMLYLAERLRLVSVQDSTERLRLYLQTEAQNGEVRLGFPKDELARRLGISRSSLFRALNALAASNEIKQLPGGRIILCSPK